MEIKEALGALLDAIESTRSARNPYSRRSAIAASWGDRIANRWILSADAFDHGSEPEQYDALVHLLTDIEWKVLDQYGPDADVSEWLSRSHSRAQGAYEDARTYVDRKEAGLV